MHEPCSIRKQLTDAGLRFRPRSRGSSTERRTCRGAAFGSRTWRTPRKGVRCQNARGTRHRDGGRPAGRGCAGPGSARHARTAPWRHYRHFRPSQQDRPLAGRTRHVGTRRIRACTARSPRCPYGREIRIRHAALFGRLTIVVPRQTRVVDLGLAIFGRRNIGSAVGPAADPDAPLIRLSGLCLLGRVTVRHEA